MMTLPSDQELELFAEHGTDNPIAYNAVKRIGRFYETNTAELETLLRAYLGQKAEARSHRDQINVAEIMGKEVNPGWIEWELTAKFNATAYAWALKHRAQREAHFKSKERKQRHLDIRVLTMHENV